jgi:hypothetical protein
MTDRQFCNHFQAELVLFTKQNPATHKSLC